MAEKLMTVSEKILNHQVASGHTNGLKMPFLIKTDQSILNALLSIYSLE